MKQCLGMVLLLTFTVSCIGERDGDCVRIFESYLKVEIDWRDISPRPEEMKILFFPEDGSLPFFRYIDHSGQLIQVSNGEYRVLLYNWMSTGDVQRIRFAGEEGYATTEAYTDFRGIVTFLEEALIQPDSLYAWSSGKETVIIAGKSGRDTITLRTSPLSLTRQYDFFIPVQGLRYVRAAEAVISGAARGVYLSDGRVLGPGNLISVSINKASGGLKCHFSAFGFVAGQPNVFRLRLTLIDGTTMDVEADLTAEIAAGSVDDFTLIEVPYTSAGGGGFTDPGFEDWNEVDEEIPI